MKIEVTDDDIANGERHYCDTCPIARALERDTGLKAHASPGTIILYTQPAITKMGTPAVCRRFMEDFDTGRPVEPFSFEISFEPASVVK